MQNFSTPALDSQQCQMLLSLAHARARSLGLTGEDPEDCALAFVEHLLQEIDLHPQKTLLHVQSSPWLFRCADNWARNYARGLRRRSLHEQPWPVQVFDQHEFQGTALSAADPGLEQRILRQEIMHRLEAALGQLTPVQQTLFRRHCVEGETLVHIAEDTKRSPAAVRQAFCLLRHRLQRILELTGLSKREAIDYLYHSFR